MLTLSCKAVKNTDADYEVQWKIQFPGTDGWMKFLYCRHKSSVRCHVQISTLPEGLKVLSNPNGTMTLERSERNAARDHARIMCQVHGISDHSLASHHLYEVNFSARCKFSLLVGLLVMVLSVVQRNQYCDTNQRKRNRGSVDSSERQRNRGGRAEE